MSARLLVAGAAALALGAIAVAAGAGFLLGSASARDLPVAPPPTPPARAAAAIAADLAELALPRTEASALLAWRGAAAEAEKAFARHGLALDLADEAKALERLKSALGPGETAAEAEELAALLDARAAIEAAADHARERDALLRLARRLDPDAARDSIRAPLLANDADAVRIVAAELDPAPQRPRTAALLGAALLRFGDVDDALDVWRAAATEHPDDAVVHLLLGWRLLAVAPPAVDEARRHLEAARALLPRSAAVKGRLDALR